MVRKHLDSLLIRQAHQDDVPAITAIYGHHVRHGLASFEEQPPDTAEMHRRMADLQTNGFPYLVAELAGKVVGYSYAGPYRTRPGYRYSAECSVYLDEAAQGHGIGKALLASIVERCTEAGYRQMVAVIGDSENVASIGLHASLGFEMTGKLHAIGFKHGRWVDSVLMQRPLGEGAETLPAAE